MAGAAGGVATWACANCTYENHGEIGFCEICEAPRPAPPVRDAGYAGLPAPSAGDEDVIALGGDEWRAFSPRGGRVDADVVFGLDAVSRIEVGPALVAPKLPSPPARPAPSFVVPAAPVGPALRAQQDLEALVQRSLGRCTPDLLRVVENVTQRELKMQLRPAGNWLLSVDARVLASALARVQRGFEVLGRLVNKCVLDERALHRQRCAGCGVSGSDSRLWSAGRCGHAVCAKCARARVLAVIDGAPAESAALCLSRGCAEELPAALLQQVVSRAEFARYEAALTESALSAAGGVIVTCPNKACGNRFEVEQNSRVPDAITERDEQGRPWARDVWEHYCLHRVRCRNCNTDFCSKCRAAPYHRGFTCEQLAEYKAARHCRFCQAQLRAENTVKRPLDARTLADVCTAPACAERALQCCPQLLPCGHACQGLVGEREHLGCLRDGCAGAVVARRACDSKGGGAGDKQGGDDFCNICFVEGLSSAPCARLECGHIFHAQCALDKVRKGWPGNRITFGFLDCPLCKQTMRHDSLAADLRRFEELRAAIEKKALLRLRVENMERDEKLVRPDSRFYNKPLEYAMASFAYYVCAKCSKPYFGGRRDCEQNNEANNRPAAEFVCYDCGDMSKVECKDASHGEYRMWKCRFCCSPASWFCWGTTHFCDYCHSNDPWGRAKWPREKFKQCPGRESCKLRVAHPPNGSEAECEFYLGCAMCAADRRRLDERAAALEGGAAPPPPPPAPAPAPPPLPPRAARRKSRR